MARGEYCGGKPALKVRDANRVKGVSVLKAGQRIVNEIRGGGNDSALVEWGLESWE